jgi:hypothetical protein
VPDVVLGIEDTALNKVKKILCSHMLKMKARDLRVHFSEEAYIF